MDSHRTPRTPVSVQTSRDETCPVTELFDERHYMLPLQAGRS